MSTCDTQYSYSAIDTIHYCLQCSQNQSACFLKSVLAHSLASSSQNAISTDFSIIYSLGILQRLASPKII